MPSTRLRRQVPLAQQMQEILADRIRDGVYPSGSQLPPESDLAAEFDVSRATVRTALSSLAAHGLVIRRQGAGTFVTDLPRISNPLDQAIDFQELIASFGYAPSVRHHYFAIVQPDPEMAETLQMEPGALALSSHKVFLADGQPVIYCVNMIPAHLFEEVLLEKVKQEPERLEPIYDFMEQCCGERVALHVSKIRAATAGSCEFHGGLPLDPWAPVLVIDGVAYNDRMNPLFHTYEYHHHPEGLMTLDLIRRRNRRQ